jgi:hypothetical protein
VYGCRGDSHYGRVEAMDWAEDNGTDYIFGLAGNAVLDALVVEIADDLCNQKYFAMQSIGCTFWTFVKYIALQTEKSRNEAGERTI